MKLAFRQFQISVSLEISHFSLKRSKFVFSSVTNCTCNVIII